jgi:DNA-binding MarR family transcriptional regulator
MIKGAADRSEHSSVVALSRRLQLAQSTVTELVQRAVGLIEREQSGIDARSSYLRLTPEGERRLRQSLTSLESERRQLREATDRLTG